MKIIFGPIDSRRFGRSLGVDLSDSFKQCNFDCLYCELLPLRPVSKQSNSTGVELVLSELKEALSRDSRIDVITITANGEPTLYPDLRHLMEEIDSIKGSKKTLILTNSSTLVDSDVFDILLGFDQVKLSLDAVTQPIFKKIDRPVDGVDIVEIIEAIGRFSKEFQGDLFVETLFVKGVNDSRDHVKKLNSALKKIELKRIDIGTIDRPSAYDVKALRYQDLLEIAKQFDADLPIHIASRNSTSVPLNSYSDTEIMSLLKRRPLSMGDIEMLFDVGSKLRLQALRHSGKIIEKKSSNITFFTPNRELDI